MMTKMKNFFENDMNPFSKTREEEEEEERRKKA